MMLGIMLVIFYVIKIQKKKYPALKKVGVFRIKA